MQSKQIQTKFFIHFLFFTFFYGCTSINELDEIPKNSQWKIWFLDIGQGSSTLVKENENFWLFDVGPNSSRAANVLDSLGVKNLQGLFLSHNDLDHYGGLFHIIESGISIKTIYRSHDLKIATTLESYLDSLSFNHQIQVDTIYRGWEHGSFDSLRIQLLWPYKGHNFEGNAASQVFKILIGQTSTLLMGDLEYEQEIELIQKENFLEATVLNVGHHGSKTSSSLELLEKIMPKWAIISSGVNNYGHPESSTLANLYHSLQDSSQLLRTDSQGTIELNISKGGYFWPQIEGN